MITTYRITDDGVIANLDAVFKTKGVAAGIRLALQAATEAEDMARQDTAKQRWDYYEKQFGTYLEEEIENRWPNTAAKMKPFIAVQPVVGPIVRKRALVMKNGVKAEVMGPDGKAVDDAKTTALHEILPDNWQETLKKIERMVDLQKRITVYVRFIQSDPITGKPKIEWDITPAHAFEVVQDPERLTHAAGYVIRATAQDTISDTSVNRLIWTKEAYAYVDEDGALINEITENPYNGVMPLADFIEDVAVERYWGLMDESFITGQDNVNILWTLFMVAMSLQSVGIPVRTNAVAGVDMALNPFTFVDLKQALGEPAPDFHFETPDTNINQIVDGIGSYVDMLYQSQGVPPWRRTKQVLGADGQQMELRDILETRQEKVGIYETQIRRLMQITSIVWATHTVRTANYKEVPVESIKAIINPQQSSALMRRCQARWMKFKEWVASPGRKQKQSTIRLSLT